MADEKNISELEALKIDIKEHFRDICGICKYSFEVSASECECGCECCRSDCMYCTLDCICRTCFDCNKWEWRGIKPNA